MIRRIVVALVLTATLRSKVSAQSPTTGLFVRYSDADSMRIEHHRGGFGGREYTLVFHKDGRIVVLTDSIRHLRRRRASRRNVFTTLTSLATIRQFNTLPDTIWSHPVFGDGCGTDAPTVIVTLFHPRGVKTVVDYQGCPRAPAALRQLEAVMDSTAGVRP